MTRISIPNPTKAAHIKMLAAVSYRNAKGEKVELTGAQLSEIKRNKKSGLYDALFMAVHKQSEVKTRSKIDEEKK